MNVVKIKCTKRYQHADGRVWLAGDTYEMTAREWAALKAEVADWASYFAE